MPRKGPASAGPFFSHSLPFLDAPGGTVGGWFNAYVQSSRFNVRIDSRKFNAYIESSGVNVEVEMKELVVRLPEQLGELLRAARTRKGITQRELAESFGTTIQAISRLEKNAGVASFDRIHKLCTAVGLELIVRERPAPRSTKPLMAEW
jgi:HTH-type transcriptional regulator / antitoxin HipB